MGAVLNCFFFLTSGNARGVHIFFFLERGLKVEEGGGYLKFLHSPYEGIKMVFTTHFSYLRFSFF